MAWKRRSAPRLAGLVTAPRRARLVTGETLKVPQVLAGGDPALQPLGAAELPRCRHRRTALFSPSPAARPAGSAGTPSAPGTGATMARLCLGAAIAQSLAQSSTFRSCHKQPVGTSADSFR